MKSVCIAIYHLHQANRLYLDLKPQNIWCCKDLDKWYVSLFDFDTVTDVAVFEKIREGEWVENYIPKSSPGYAAPEQENGDYKNIGYHTDAFAIGAVFYWLLTGNEANQNTATDFDWMKEIGCLIERQKSSDATKEKIKNIIEELLEWNSVTRKRNFSHNDSVVNISHRFEELESITAGGDYRHAAFHDKIDKLSESTDEHGKTLIEIKEILNADRQRNNNSATNAERVFDIIDDDYVSGVINDIDSDDKLALSNRYFFINGHSDTVMSAVCCELCVKDNSIIGEIYSHIKRKRVVFFTGDGGTGKTTLLCQLAVYLKSSTAGTLYVNFENRIDKDSLKDNLKNHLDNHKQENEKTIILVDNPLKNPDAVKELYKLSSSAEYKNYLTIVLCDRPENLVELIEDDISRLNSWIGLADLIYLSNDTAADNNIRLFTTYCKNITTIEYPKQHKKAIIENWAKFVTENCSSDKEIINDLLQEADYNNTIVGIIVFLENEYNNRVSNSSSLLATPKMFESDWDLWSKKTKQFDEKCKKRNISDAFKHIAALGIMGVQVSCKSIQDFTGFDFSEKFYEEFPEDTYLPVCITDNNILLKHDTVAEYYFSANNRIKIEKCLIELLESLSDEDYQEVTYKVFHFSRFFDEAIKRPVDKSALKSILKKIEDTPDLKNRVVESGKLYSLELSKIMLEGKNIEEAIDRSFSRSYPDPQDKKYAEALRKYLMAALWHCDRLPDCFLLFDSPIKNKKLSDVVGMLKESKILSEDDYQRIKFTDWRIQIFEKMFKEYPSDMVALFKLAKAYEDKGEFDKARQLYKDYLLKNGVKLTGDSFNVFTSYFKNFRKDIKSIHKSITQLYEEKGDISEIKKLKTIRDALRQTMIQEIKKMVDDFYEQTINQSIKAQDEETKNYTSIATDYILQLLNLKRFKEAYDILEKMPQKCYDSLYAYRIYMKWGYLYQDLYSNAPHPVEYSDNEKAIEFFEKAWALVQDLEREIRAEVLLSLMNTCEREKNKEKSIKYAVEAIKLTKNKGRKNKEYQKALEILKKYQIEIPDQTVKP